MNTTDVAGSQSGETQPRNDQNKVTVLFKAVSNAPALRKNRLTISRSETAASLVTYLRKTLKFGSEASIYIFLSSSFSPSLDRDIGTLFDCFSTEGKLIVQYCTTVAWG